MRVVLFDDARAADWMPFVLTRPVGELLFGAHTFRARAELLFGPCVALVSDARLSGFEEPGAAPVVAPDALTVPAPTLFLSSRAVIDWGVRFDPRGPGLIRVNGATVGCFVPGGSAPPADFFARPEAFDLQAMPDGSVRFESSGARLPDSVVAGGAANGVRGYDAPGRVLENVWDLVAHNAEQVAKDWAASKPDAASAASLPAGEGVQTIGGAIDRVRLGASVTIEPGVVFDVSTGPIWIDDGATIRAFSRVQGPAFVGRESTLLGGSFSGISIGPVCKVHGEMEESVVLGYSNKAHDGFLGHAYLGRWVNLGALTTNSDLKNNYGTIRMWTPGGQVDTGLVKIGCLLGDHVKTGIGVMLNTGTIVGAGCNLFGAAQPPKHVPPFCWGSGTDLMEYDVEKFMDSAETVMRRRNVALSEGQANLLRRAWARSRASARSAPGTRS